MIENTADLLPIYMLLSAAFGFLAGDALGDSRRHRKCLEQINDDLEHRSRRPAPSTSRYISSSSVSAA